MALVSDTKAPSGATSAAAAPGRTAVVLRMTLRNLRAGLAGFGVFLACIALGVAAISGVGSVARSLGDGLASQGRLILGGDVAASLLQREATPDELAWLGAQGDLASVATMRAMVRTPDGRTALIEPKAVDAGYPRVGALVLDPPLPVTEALGRTEQAGAEIFGAAVDRALLSRLDLKLGDRVTVGSATLELRSVIVTEPD